MLFFAAALIPFSSNAQTMAPLRCLIEAHDMIELSMPVAGIIAEVAVARGDRVGAGDVVARLNSRVEKIQLERAQAEAEDTSGVAAAQARRNFLVDQAERVKTLAARSAVSEATSEEAIQEAEVAEQALREAIVNREFAAIEVERAKILIDQKTLRSPVTGIVTEKLLSVGEYQAGDTHILTVAEVDRLRVEAFAPLSYYAHIKLGQTATIQPEAPFDGEYQATVTVIDRVFDAATATFGVRLELPNTDIALPAGLRCTVTF